MITLPFEEFVPAPAQGTLGFQTRSNDEPAISAVGSISSKKNQIIATAERHLLSLIGGGCHVPFGAYCESKGEGLRMTVAYSPDGRFSQFTMEGTANDIVTKSKEKLDALYSSQEN